VPDIELGGLYRPTNHCEQSRLSVVRIPTRRRPRLPVTSVN